MTITLVGVNHQTAGVDIRECLAVPAHELPDRLADAVACPGVAEALMLSTCNRSELYLAAENGEALPSAEEVYGRVLQVAPERFAGHAYVLQGAAAAAHLFRVAAGADSMVLGETEIMGQLREALDCARETGAAGRVLSRLGERALSVGKRARTETRIDKGCMSVASVAADLARQIFDRLASRRLLVLGAGEMGALVARRLIDNGARQVTIVSRTLERAQALAGEIGGEAVAFEGFLDELMRADIVITSTSSPHPLITVDRVQVAAGSGRRRPLLLIDLAIPRDVDPGVREIDDVYLYDLDDLQEFAREIADQRLCELPAVDSIAEDEARGFMVWTQSQEVVPLLLEVRQRAEAIRDEEIGLLLAEFPELSRKADKALHLMSKRLVRRLLDRPLERLRELCATGLTEGDLEIARALLAPDEPVAEAPPEAEEEQSE